MTVLADSWAWIEYFKGSKPGQKVKAFIEGDEELIVSTINVAEIYTWILRSYDERTAEEKRNVIKERCIVVDVTETIAVEAAKLRHKLKWGLGDSIIYATSKMVGSMILTGDPDFKNAENIIYVERE